MTSLQIPAQESEQLPPHCQKVCRLEAGPCSLHQICMPITKKNELTKLDPMILEVSYLLRIWKEEVSMPTLHAMHILFLG